MNSTIHVLNVNDLKPHLKITSGVSTFIETFDDIYYLNDVILNELEILINIDESKLIDEELLINFNIMMEYSNEELNLSRIHNKYKFPINIHYIQK